MTRKQIIWRIVLAIIVVTLLVHWKDAMNGFIDGFKDG